MPYIIGGKFKKIIFKSRSKVEEEACFTED
jgi:hypothetical protein